MLQKMTARPRVLIADDDTALAETMRDMLEDDFVVELASDGAEAVLRVRHCQPDVLVLDAQMPRLDGFAACRILRRNPLTADLPIIMVTGATAPEMVAAAFAAGATDYLPKPFSISQLRARATTSLLRRRAS